MNSKRIGNIGEAKALSKFVELNIPVYIPFGDNETADLVADFNGKLNKIQVKTSIKAQDGKMEFNTASSMSKSHKGDTVHKYTETEVDYYVFYNIDRDKIFLVPFDKAGARGFTIRYELPKNGQKIGVHMEEDFTFEKIICPLTQVGEEDSLLNC